MTRFRPDRVTRGCHHVGMNRINKKQQKTLRPQVFVPVTDEQIESMPAHECLVPYQAGGIVLSQVFRE